MKWKVKTRYLFYGVNIVVPLLIGLLLYITFRRDAYVSILISKYLNLPALSRSILPKWLVSFFRNYASDILWAYSLGFAVMLTLGYNRRNLVFSFFVCICFEAFLEVLQKVEVLHGTFDYFDILLEAVFICLALFNIKKHEEAQNEKSSKNS